MGNEAIDHRAGQCSVNTRNCAGEMFNGHPPVAAIVAMGDLNNNFEARAPMSSIGFAHSGGQSVQSQSVGTGVSQGQSLIT